MENAPTAPPTLDYNQIGNAELTLVHLLKEFKLMEPVQIVHLIPKDLNMVSNPIL